jgi:hypothetical protein
MPSISEFFGIKIYMYYAHGKHHLPYFHARYQGHDASFSIDSQKILAGHLPPKVVKLICEWAKFHRTELLDNWVRIQNNEPTRNIRGADND